VTSIGTSAFYGCYIETATVPTIACNYIKNSSLKTIVINGGTSIEANLFKDYTSLKSVTIGSSITSISEYAFYGCTNLEEIHFNATTMNINLGGLLAYNYIFYNAGINSDGGIKVTIGANVKKIPDELFEPYPWLSDDGAYAPKITSVVFEEGSVCTSIGNRAFEFCKYLTGISIPDSVTSIGEHAFARCYNLTSVTLPNGITSINSGVFSQCASLTNIVIPDSVTSIGPSAFSSCSGLMSLTISSSITNISDYAFYNCLSLEELHFNATSMSDFVENNYVFYKAGTSGNGIKVTVGANVTKIPGYLFYPNSPETTPKIASVVFEEGSACKTIGKYAFYGCSNLTSDLVIPMGVTSIGEYAFYKCSGLTGDLTIPAGITCINAYTFYHCEKLTGVTMSNNVTSIGKAAFSDCYGITHATIGTGVVTLADYAFNECHSLTSITIPASVTSIGKYAFDNAGLTSVTLPAKTGWTWFGYLDSDLKYGEALLSASDLSNSATAATYLKDTHSSKYLICKNISESSYNPYSATEGTTFGNPYKIKLNGSHTITFTPYNPTIEYRIFKFTAIYSGIHYFQIANRYDLYGYLYDSDTKRIVSETNLSYSNSGITGIKHSLTVGDTVYFVIRSTAAGCTTDVSITCEGSNWDKAIPLYANRPTTVNITGGGQEVHFKIVNSKDWQWYSFYSIGDCDTYGELYTHPASDTYTLVASDDNSGGDGNFKINDNVFVQAHLKVKLKSKTATGSFILRADTE
jgi:hypothetical protein